MLQIRLGTHETVDPTKDPLGRTSIGWWEGMSEREAWDAGRGVWRLKATRVLEQDEIQIVSPTNEILVVATITAVRKYDDRRAVEGDVKWGDARVGQPAPHPHTSRNPVAYV